MGGGGEKEKKEEKKRKEVVILVSSFSLCDALTHTVLTQKSAWYGMQAPYAQI